MKEEIKVRFFDDEGYYPITVTIPRVDLTIPEAKELLKKLEEGIEIAEWNEKKKPIIAKDIEINHWTQDYLESFNDDGLSMD